MLYRPPNEKVFLSQHDYPDFMVLLFIWNVSLLAMVVAFLFIVFFLLKKYQLRVVQNTRLRDSILTVDEGSQRAISEEQTKTEEYRSSLRKQTPKVKNPTSRLFKVVNLMTSICFYLFWMVATLYFLAFYMLSFFGRGLHVDILTVFVMSVGVIIPALIWKFYTRVSDIRQIRGQVIATVILLCLWVIACASLVIVGKGTCLCFFTDKYGFLIQPFMSMSTEFTRTLRLEPTCGNFDVCHLYATVPEDPSTSVFFNAHSGLSLSNLTFVLTRQSAVVASKVSDQPYRMDNVEDNGKRYVHSVLISNLTADTLYRLKVQDSNGLVLKEIGYKTVPGVGADMVRIAAGGDLGMTQEGKLMTSYLKDFNPDVIILGGDIVYDNGLRTCYYSWDIFYSMFKPVYVHLDRLVPIILSVGNHDVGFDALVPVKMPSSLDYLPLFFVYNPQHLSKDGTSVPDPLDRLSYHYHTVGSTIHLILDSSYIVSHADQMSFIQETLQKNSQYYRFASYHNPIYSACDSPLAAATETQVAINGRQSWVPLFDSWNFTTVLEHHTHFRKMSYKIKDGKKSEKGTRYVGDGSWGVANSTCTYLPAHIDLLEQFASEQPNHYWQIIVSKVSDPRLPTAQTTLLQIWATQYQVRRLAFSPRFYECCKLYSILLTMKLLKYIILLQLRYFRHRDREDGKGQLNIKDNNDGAIVYHVSRSCYKFKICWQKFLQVQNR